MYENINNFAQKRVEADYRPSDYHELRYISIYTYDRVFIHIYSELQGQVRINNG